MILNRHLTRSLCALCVALLPAVARPASADIISDLASATIIEDFLFNDAEGTAIEAAANSANPGNLFDADADNADVVTNGTGQLNVSLKNNTAFGTNYVNNDNITTGRVFGVMELTWDFQSVFDPDADEELRITLTNNDPRGTQVTAQVEIQRTGQNDLNINGVASPSGDGATNVADFPLSITQSDKFIAVVDADLDNDVYSIHFSDDGGSTFTTTGSGNLAPTRIANALRLVLNEDFVDDSVLIDRVYLARIPEPTGAILAILGVLGLAVARRHGSR